MGAGVCLKDGCNFLLFILSVTSLIFFLTSLYEIVQMGTSVTTTLESRGWLFCVAYPFVKVVLPILWFSLACYDVYRKCRLQRGDYYSNPLYLAELFAIVVTLFFVVTPPSLIGAISFCLKFGFFGNNAVISTGGDQFTQLLLAHTGIAVTETLTFMLTVELFPAYVLQNFRTF